MDAETLRRELERRGLRVLGVGQHQVNPEVLVVYLHGNAGQWIEGWARRAIARVPGVVAASDSVPTPTTILVRVRLTDVEPVPEAVDTDSDSV